jgi:hypothetical protein
MFFKLLSLHEQNSRVFQEAVASRRPAVLAPQQGDGERENKLVAYPLI